MHKTGLHFWKEKTKKAKAFLCSFCWLLTAGEKCGNQEGCRGSLYSPLAGCQSPAHNKPPSARVTRAHTPRKHTHAVHASHTFLPTVPSNLLSPNYSRLEPMLLSLILSVRGLWGNSDISVWCLAYVSRALPGPIKLIFNVCPTLDGQSQGWHRSRGDINGVWWRPRHALGCSLWDLCYGRTSVTLQLKHLQWTSPAAQIRDKNTSDWSDCWQGVVLGLKSI